MVELIWTNEWEQNKNKTRAKCFWNEINEWGF